MSGDGLSCCCVWEWTRVTSESRNAAIRPAQRIKVETKRIVRRVFAKNAECIGTLLPASLISQQSNCAVVKAVGVILDWGRIRQLAQLPTTTEKNVGETATENLFL